MNKIIVSLMLAFFVQVKFPAGMSKTYDNVKAVMLMDDGFVWRLTLQNDKVIYVPAFFTVIEEK